MTEAAGASGGEAVPGGLSSAEDVLLYRAADEASRLLDADGAYVYAHDPATGMLWYRIDAGLDPAAFGGLARPQRIPVGVGVVGKAVAERRVVVTEDYATDAGIEHGDVPDRFVRSLGLRSMVAAPIITGDAVYGALGVFSSRPDAFSAPHVALVRALADHAGASIANARLIEELDRSRAALAHQAELERSLRELGTAMAAAPDPEGVVQRVIEEALRLVGGDGARIDILDREERVLKGVYVAGEEAVIRNDWPYDAGDRLEVGISGRAVVDGRTFITADYLEDPLFVHGPGPDGYVKTKGIRGAISTPLVADEGRFGALTVWSTRPDAFDEEHAAILETIAGQASVALARARLIDELGRWREELAASEARYRFLVENSPDIIYSTDAEGVITFFSGAVEQRLGWEPSEVVGRHFSDIVRTEGRAPRGVRFNEMATSGRAVTMSRMELIARDGRLVPYEVSASPMRTDGHFSGIVGAARDIEDRERLERELRSSEARYRYLVQSSPDLIWMTDADGRFTFVSDQAERILGSPASELIGTSLVDMAVPDGRRGAQARFLRLQHKPAVVHSSRLEIQTRDGRRVPMEITGIGMVVDGRFVGAHGTARDIAERDRMERNLLRQAADLAASEERAHLSRELHDSVTQAMFSMTLVSRSIELLLDKDPSAVPARLAELRELQRDALAELRALVFELRPGNVEQQGLVTALRTHAAALSGRIGLPVVIEADLPDRPALEVEDALYRIAQEALHNVVKHAGAHQARVDLARVPDGIRLRVRDDGHGFDPATVPDGHLGIAGMHARAARLGGRLTVTSTPGQGTVVEALVPATAARHADEGVGSVASRGRSHE